MMNGTCKKQTVKGFTLVEMMTVVAIIIILLGVLTPSLMTYYRNSRLRAANSDAKMIYNAAQTEVMRYMNRDRVTSVAANKSGFGNQIWMAYQPGVGSKYSTLPSVTSTSLLPTTDTSGGNTAAVCNQTIAKVNQTVSGAADVCWAVYVNNYIVKSSVSAANTNTNYVGFYSANKQQASERSSATYGNCYLNVLSKARTDGYDKASGTATSATEATTN